MRLAESTIPDEITLVGGGWFPVFSCSQRRSFISSSWTALKERVAPTLFKARSPHRSSCRRYACKERRPSTEIRLDLYSYVGECVMCRWIEGCRPCTDYPTIPLLNCVSPYWHRLTQRMSRLSNNGTVDSQLWRCATCPYVFASTLRLAEIVLGRL